MKNFNLKNLILIAFILVGVIFECCYSADCFGIGKAYFNKKDYYTAESYFQKALKQNPENYACRYYLGHTYVYLGEIFKAKVEYEKVMTYSPNSNLKKLAMQSMKSLNLPKVSKTKQRTIAKMKDNYFDSITLDGQYVRWNKFPLNVYVAPSEFSSVIKNAFKTWEKQTNSLITFNFVSDQQKAQIKVSVVTSLPHQKEEGYEAGLASIRVLDGIIQSAQIDILKNDPKTGILQDENLVYTTTLHEIAHALGLQGHSALNEDIMSAINTTGTKKITKRDLNTLIMLYTATGAMN